MIKKFAAAAVIPLLLCSCSVDNSEKFAKSIEYTQSADTGGITHVEVSQYYGNCCISYGDTDKAVIHSRCEISGLSEKNVKKILDNTELSCTKKDDTLYICFIDSQSGEELSESSSGTSLLKSVNIVTDLNIELPESFDEFTVRSNYGAMVFDSLRGSFSVKSEGGDIRLENAAVTDDSFIDAGVGNVDCSLSAAGKCSLDIRSGVGSIELHTGDLSYEEISRSDKLVEQEITVMVDNSLAVNMKADIGDIKVSK